MNNINEALDYIYSFMGKKTLHKKNLNHIKKRIYRALNKILNLINTWAGAKNSN